MGQNSKIEWTDHTVNLWWGCTKVHEGCDNCYAEYLSDVRYKNGLWGNDAPRKLIKSSFPNLDKFQELANSENKTHRVFIGSMMDIFEKPKKVIDGKGNQLNGILFKNDIGYVGCNTNNRVMTTEMLRDRLFELITSGRYPNLLFLFLTKRPSNINKYIPENWKANPLKNVMFGTSVSTQKNAKTLVPQILKVNGYKFLSVEPQIEEINITNKALDNCYSIPTKYEDGFGIEWTDPGDKFIGINWVIQGGESGHNKRPFNIDWAYSMKQQCKDANVPYFLKQIDKIQPIPEDLMIREFPKQMI